MKPEMYLTEIPHEEKEIIFQYPAFKGIYVEVAKQVDKAKLKRPNSKETASLVYDAWKNPKEQYESKIIKILKDNWFWEFTGNLYLPKSNEEINNGVILETGVLINPLIINGKLNMDKNSLIKRLQENDPLVKFVPFGYKTGEQNILELSKNPYIIARYGEEGAEKMAEVASKYNKNPVIWSFDSVDEEKLRISALGEHWDLDNKLLIDGGTWNNSAQGSAFGISVAD